MMAKFVFIRYNVMEEYYYECNTEIFFDTFGKLITKR
jgi:hypothetical protein